MRRKSARASGGKRMVAEHKIIIGHPSGVMDVTVVPGSKKGSRAS